MIDDFDDDEVDSDNDPLEDEYIWEDEDDELVDKELWLHLVRGSGIFQFGLSNSATECAEEHRGGSWEHVETFGPIDADIASMTMWECVEDLTERGAQCVGEHPNFKYYSEPWIPGTIPVVALKNLIETKVEDILKTVEDIQEEPEEKRYGAEHLERRGATLRGIDFTGLNFSDKLDVSEADLRRSDFTGVAFTAFSNFWQSDLAEVSFSGCDLTSANFHNCSLTKSLFDGASLAGAHFSVMHMTLTSFRKTNLTNAEFSSCDLRGASFDGADLSGAQFINCDLRGTTFLDATVRGATISVVIVDPSNKSTIERLFRHGTSPRGSTTEPMIRHVAEVSNDSVRVTGPWAGRRPSRRNLPDNSFDDDFGRLWIHDDNTGWRNANND